MKNLFLLLVCMCTFSMVSAQEKTEKFRVDSKELVYIFDDYDLLYWGFIHEWVDENVSFDINSEKRSELVFESWEEIDKLDLKLNLTVVIKANGKKYKKDISVSSKMKSEKKSEEDDDYVVALAEAAREIIKALPEELKKGFSEI